MFKLVVVDERIGRSLWEMYAAFPIMARTSGSQSTQALHTAFVYLHRQFGVRLDIQAVRRARI